MTNTPGGGPDSGDYPDRDLPEGDVEPGEGSYTDEETPEEKRGEKPDLRGPDDIGEYTDADEVPEHRPPPPQGGYTQKDDGTSGTDHAEENRHG
jgi:hypothetical protein